jgi:diguanylate cyclase (GGDEF)-like protein
VHVGDETLRVLWVESVVAPFALDAQGVEGSAFGPFTLERCSGLDKSIALLGERRFDAVLLCVGSKEAGYLPLWPGLSQALLEAAVVVCRAGTGDVALTLGLLRAGVQDVLDAESALPGAAVARSLRLAVERQRLERASRIAHATDLRTGLPNRQQLIDHMSQLLALRAREPAPMALLVLRIEGFATTEAALGREAANVLRRKVAVRLRAAVRASDVVAALAADTFALLLASTEEPVDADLVARKLLAALHAPFTLSGERVTVSASLGISRFPADAADAGVMMRQAVAAAAAAPAEGRGGFANWRESVWQDTGAANDGDIEGR